MLQAILSPPTPGPLGSINASNSVGTVAVHVRSKWALSSPHGEVLQLASTGGPGSEDGNSLARVGRVDPGTFEVCSPLDANLYTFYPPLLYGPHPPVGHLLFH